LVGLLFGLFWLWIIVLGFKGVMRRLGQLSRWLCTPWVSTDDLMPTLRGTVGQNWSDGEYRHYSQLAAREPVPAITAVTKDMEQALDQERRTAEQLGRDISEWQNAIEQLKKSGDEWTDRAAKALSAGRNDLARAAIAERQKCQQRVGELESDVSEMSRMLTTHSSDIQNLESKLSNIYRRNRLAETRLTAAESSARTRQLLYGEQVKDALGRFEELEREADVAEGEADALKMGSAPADDTSALEAEIAALRSSGNAAAGFGRKGAAT
jgi:phage shock protein A